MVFLSTASLASAQQPPQQQPPPPAQLNVDQVLAKWEQAMTKINSLYVDKLTREKKNKVFGSVDTYKGTAAFLKPNKASLEMRKDGKRGSL